MPVNSKKSENNSKKNSGKIKLKKKISINLSDDPEAEYALTLPAGLPADATGTELLYGEGTITAPTLTAQGGFENYLPAESLAPFATLIIKLK